MGTYLLQSYLDAAWRLHPDRQALVDDQGALTYRELGTAADRLACCLQANGVRRQDRILVFMKRSTRVVVALVGVLKADAIYVPTDAKAPMERLLKVVKDCRPCAVICDGAAVPVLDRVRAQIPSVRFLVVFGEQSHDSGEIPRVFWEQNTPQAVPRPQYRNIDTDAAYILYTSGSTGSPKGVTISHLNVINYIEWAVEYFRLDAEDRVLGTAPFHFDMSTFDVYTALKAGATLCIAPERHLLFPNKLLDLIEQEGITIWKGVSSLLMYLSSTGSLKPGRIPSLQQVLFGGEVLPTKHLVNWMEQFPAKRFFNVYGPTEATGISACYPVPCVPASLHEPIPIGRACTNTEIYVLAEENRPAQVGETGEICIRGSGLSLGYWDDEEKTTRAFTRNPLGHSQNDRIYRTGDLARLRADGLIEYLGRKDYQIKYMGYRIELFEIEQAILCQDNIHQAAVLLCDTRQSEVQELVAFVSGPGRNDLDAVLEELGRAVPTYMLPKRIIGMEEIPLTDRGKTDRVALREFFERSITVALEGGEQ